MTTTNYDFPKVGCYIDESAGSADDCNRRTIELAQAYGFTSEDLTDGWEESEFLSEIGDNAIDYLNTLETRSFMYWMFEDNSLFLMADVDGAREDVGFVSWTSVADAKRAGVETDPDDSSYPPDDYQGEWLHVSDHGNATLYVRENGNDTEVWGVV